LQIGCDVQSAILFSELDRVMWVNGSYVTAKRVEKRRGAEYAKTLRNFDNPKSEIFNLK